MGLKAINQRISDMKLKNVLATRTIRTERTKACEIVLADYSPDMFARAGGT